MSSLLNRFKQNPWPSLIIVFLVGALTYKIASDYLNSKELQIRAGKWDKLLLILSQVDKHYVDTVNFAAVTEDAIPEILQRLDPHSVYLSPKELESADEQLQGNFDGIGIQFNIPNDTAVVIHVIQGGPSERAGIVSGDRLVKVNGETVAGVNMNQDSLVRRLRGKSGSRVTVAVKRVGVKDLISFDIKRDKIPVKSVDVSYMVNDTLGYIKLSKFTRSSYSEFMEGVASLRKQGLRELIFDLRGNTGGYFDQALLMANEFLNKGDLIVYMAGRNRPRQDFFADNSGRCRDLALKVLIDEGSASSSEIFAGAIQDNDRGEIIGRRSFGKGLVQEPIYFSDNSGIRLTVARFYTPSGRSIQKPYDHTNYNQDILERYRHGEMLSADSIKYDPNLSYKTKGGRVVYGGGGVTPDVFVPVDTTGVSQYFIKVSNMGLTFKFSAMMADEYRKELNSINSLKELYAFFEGKRLEERFREYASSNGVKADNREWESSVSLIMNHIKAFTGRYSPLDDKAFYPILLEEDNVFKRAIE